MFVRVHRPTSGRGGGGGGGGGCMSAQYIKISVCLSAFFFCLSAAVCVSLVGPRGSHCFPRALCAAAASFVRVIHLLVAAK